MKKTFKRAGVAVLSMAMLLSMGAMTAMTTSAVDSGKITVSAANGVTNATVKMYKVAEINNLGSWTWVSPFSNSASFDTIKNYNADQRKALASALARQVTSTTATAATGTLSSSATSVELTAAAGTGYYLILVSSTDAGTLIQPILQQISNGDTATATIKGSEIPLDKTIEEIADATTNVSALKNTGVAAKGEKIEYKISSAIPSYDSAVKANDIQDYVITDTPSAGIAIDNETAAKCNLKVYIDSTEVSTGFTYAESGAGFTVTLNGTQVKANMGKTIDITFDAVLDTDAVIGTDGNPNTATVTYGNDYATGGGSTTKRDVVTVFTVTLDGTKIKQGHTDTKLSGAEFKLYKGSYDSDNPNTNLVGTVTTAADGKVTFDRVTAGTYVLVESVAPAGYKAIEPTTITVTATKSKDEYNGTFTGTRIFTTFNAGLLSGDIEDSPADALPGTGGMGTILFTVGGAAVVLLAGALFVVYMRKRKVEE